MSTPDTTVRVTDCTRCGAPCRVGPPPNPDARLLKRSQSKGLCVNCATTVALRTYRVLEDAPPDKLAGLLDERVQAQFGQVLAAGMADADLTEIDWRAVVDQWALPMPKGWRPL